MSRNLDDLKPVVAAKVRAWLDACTAAGIDVLITCTLRDNAEQARLYAQGRTAPGPKVTNAKPGQSMHNYGAAADFVPIRNGKPVWGTSGADGKLWEQIGELAEAHGLEWAGRWVKFKEMAHVQFTNGHPLAYFQAGGTL